MARVSGVSCAGPSGSSSVATPKSSRRTWPSSVTRMFDGLRSRCRTRLAVRVLQRGEDLQEQLQASVDPQPSRIGPGGDVLARNPLHRQVRLPAVDAGVVEPRDVRVLEPGEDVPLAGEALRHLAATRVQERKLQRDVPAERAVVPAGEPHLAHPPGAQQLHQHVRAEPLAGSVDRGRGEHRGREGLGLGDPCLDRAGGPRRPAWARPARACPATQRARRPSGPDPGPPARRCGSSPGTPLSRLAGHSGVFRLHSRTHRPASARRASPVEATGQPFVDHLGPERLVELDAGGRSSPAPARRSGRIPCPGRSGRGSASSPCRCRGPAPPAGRRGPRGTAWAARARWSRRRTRRRSPPACRSTRRWSPGTAGAAPKPSRSERLLGGHHRVGIALVGGELPDEREDERDVGARRGAEVEHRGIMPRAPPRSLAQSIGCAAGRLVRSAPEPGGGASDPGHVGGDGAATSRRGAPTRRCSARARAGRRCRNVVRAWTSATSPSTRTRTSCASIARSRVPAPAARRGTRACRAAPPSGSEQRKSLGQVLVEPAAVGALHRAEVLLVQPEQGGAIRFAGGGPRSAHGPSSPPIGPVRCQPAGMARKAVVSPVAGSRD